MISTAFGWVVLIAQTHGTKVMRNFSNRVTMVWPLIQALKVYLLVTSVGLCAGVCNQNGWFGSSSCLYQCHCAGDAVCNKASGSCPQGCDAGWFGPACQYESIGFTVTSPLNTNVSWLSDGEESTCNDGSVQTFTVLLNTPQPLTWVRLVVSEEGLLDQLHLRYLAIGGESGLIPCAQERTARVDERTVDIVCLTQRVAVLVNLHGEGVKALCSLHISGGRNVALEQQTQQSSTFRTRVAGKAVDGDPGVPGSSVAVFERTCTHTDRARSEGWWEVTFSNTVKIYRFVIYNRRRDNATNIGGYYSESRLRGFTLEAFQLNVSDAVYTFTDPSPVSQQNYTVVPQTTIDEDVNRVRISKRTDSPLLTLCEVLVFGELSCPAGTFGLECDKQCNCADDQDICFVSTGGCPSGCAPGYTGEDCRTKCPKYTFGDGCKEKCSAVCFYQQCNYVTGACDSCLEGRQGQYCEIDRPSEVSQHEEGSNDNTWAIAATVVAAVATCAAFVLGLLLWRRGKTSKEQPPIKGLNDKPGMEMTPKGFNGESNAGFQRDTPDNRPSEIQYEEIGTNTRYNNTYMEDYDHLANPGSDELTGYEIPQPLKVATKTDTPILQSGPAEQSPIYKNQAAVDQSRLVGK